MKNQMQRELMTLTTREPLAGKKILITRSKEQSASFTSKLIIKGAKPILCPLISYKLIEKEIYNKNIINNISNFDWIFFTSQNAVRFFFEVLTKNCYDSRALSKCQVAAVGYKTKSELGKYNIKADFVPKRFSFGDLVSELSERINLKNKKILHPAQTGAYCRKSLENIYEWPIYEANFIEKIDDEIINQIKEGMDIITVFSSNTAKHFYKLAEKYHLAEACHGMPLLATIGDETSDVVKQLFGRVDIIAESFTEDGLIESMEKYYAKDKFKIPSTSPS